MAIRLRMFDTASNTTLAAHDMVSDAEVAAASADIIDVWGGGTAQEAARRSMRFMITKWREETITRLENRDVADEVTALEAAGATAKALYRARFPEMP